MNSYKYAEILLPIPINTTFTYLIPDNFKELVKMGSSVVVNFGKRKLYTGIVLSLHNKDTTEYGIKNIENVYESLPIVKQSQVELWKWISEYYCCSLGEVLNAALPSMFIPNSETNIYLKESNQSIILSPNETKIINILEKSKKINIRELEKNSGISNPIKHIHKLKEKGLLDYEENIKTGFSYQTVNMIGFSLDKLEKNLDLYENILKKGKKQAEILNFLSSECENSNSNNIELEEKYVLFQTGSSKTSLKSLEEKLLISLFKKKISRFIKANNHKITDFSLSPKQEEIYNDILKEFDSNKPVLLHGVTSSGKTEIYIKLIYKALEEDKTVLYLLPEIALTTQIISRLKQHFGDLVGIFHSKYSKSERAEVYKSVLNGKLKIVLGARSSIFLPFNNLGLIIVDEEHDASYKQIDPAPRYNARDTAIVLSVLAKANIILGTATPSIESYNNSLTKKYSLIELNERFGNIKLPEVILLDLKHAYKRKIMHSHFHPILVDQIKETLENKKQVILFQNRRGFSPYIQCAECGHIPGCTDCNVSLTYHKFKNKLICHYCGIQAPVLKECPECKSTKLITKGLGTELLEDEANMLFPEARVARLDYDTTRTKKNYEKIIHDFQNYELDILIGTQMVSKGLDFNNVSLVGILNADNMLSFPDFRAFERSFQMFAQVSGRAGRKDKQGTVIIQTFDKEHPILKNVIDNDYKSMFNQQIQERQLFQYPPFYNFLIIKVKHKNLEILNRATNFLANELKKDLHNRVKGPEEPIINRIKNQFIKNIHIRFEKEISSKKLKKHIIYKCSQLKSISEFSSLNIQIDVDPM